MPPVNNVWASTTPAGTSHELTLPSGQTCRAKKLGMEGLLEAGILAQADSLTAMVGEHTRKVRGAKGRPDGEELDEASLMRDPKAFAAIMEMANKATPIIVESPVVLLHYTVHLIKGKAHTKVISEAEREKVRLQRMGEQIVFTDQIDFQDKMFLFDWAAGGLQAMTPFRGGSNPDVAGVDDESVDTLSAE